MLKPVHPAYALLAEAPLPLQNSHGYLYEHRSGAKVLSLVSPDDEKVFGINFRTPPSDDTGLPHILEHSVLCGSERFPVKEPFKEMLKTSLQTFLNAFTYPDRTCYPVASRNLKDYHHLMDVYLDAVFFPRLTPAVLGQEGWRIEWRPDGTPEFQGVVYNEMKGVYASADSRWEELCQKSMFPDSLYRFDYGGDPKAIPTLTFEDFLAFHQSCYHPANAFVFFYGNEDPVSRLERLDKVLSRVPDGPIPPEIPPQPFWGETRRAEDVYPASDQGDEGVFASLNWLLPGDCLDLDETLLANMVSHLLVRNPASPLRLALLDSSLGEDLIGNGVSSHLSQSFASFGLRGVEDGDEEAVFDCVLQALETIVRTGFSADLIDGAFNTTEFYFREQNTGGTPRGLVAMLQGLQVWMSGGDPLEALRMDERIQALRQRWDADPNLFTNWIQQALLDNPSRVEVIVRPDSAKEAAEADEEQARLRERLEEFERNPAAETAARDLAAAVDAFQTLPDPPEALASLPRLRLQDVTDYPADPPRQDLLVEGVSTLTHTAPAAGILYLDLLFDIRHIPEHELALLSLYSRALTELGTETLDHIRFNELLSCQTGGLHCQLETSETLLPSGYYGLLVLRVKCLKEKTARTLELLTDMLAHPLLGPPERVFQLLLEEKANEEANLIHNGSRVVSLRLQAAYSAAERASEEMGGLRYLEALRDLEKQNADFITHTLQGLHQRVVSREGLRIHLGGDEATLNEALAQLPRLLQAIPESTPASEPTWAPMHDLTREGLIMPSAINFVGLGTRLPADFAHHGSITVATRLIRNDFLWDQVRVRGGAYGSSCSYDRLSRIVTFTSYRDPHVRRTLDTYLAAAEWLRTLDMKAEDLEQAKIGALGALSRSQHPAGACQSALMRHLSGVTPEDRSLRWHQVRETTLADLRRFGDALCAALRQEQRISILGSREKLSDSELALHLHEVMG